MSKHYTLDDVQIMITRAVLRDRERVLAEVERTFSMQRACGCKQLCTCWDDFKMNEIENISTIRSPEENDLNSASSSQGDEST